MGVLGKFDLSSPSKKTLFQAVEMTAAVHVTEENDKHLDLQFNSTGGVEKWGDQHMEKLSLSSLSSII